MAKYWIVGSAVSFVMLLTCSLWFTADNGRAIFSNGVVTTIKAQGRLNYDEIPRINPAQDSHHEKFAGIRKNRFTEQHKICQLNFNHTTIRNKIAGCGVGLPMSCHGSLSYETDSNGKLHPVCPNYDTKSGHCGPSIFIIGAQKASTTSTFQFIKKHPDFEEGDKKELKFYSCNKIEDSEKRKAEYLDLFPSCKNCMTGEATPEYSMSIRAAKALKEDWPDARILLLIRDPADRADSHYRMVLRKNSTEKNPYLGSFAQQIKHDYELGKKYGIFDEKEGTLDLHLLDKHKHLSLLERGMYASMIEEWTQLFDKNQFMVVLYEELIDPNKQSCILREMLKFFGLRHERLPSGYFHFPSANVGVSKKIDDPESMEFLREFFKPFNRRLKEILQRDIPYDM